MSFAEGQAERGLNVGVESGVDCVVDCVVDGVEEGDAARIVRTPEASEDEIDVAVGLVCVNSYLACSFFWGIGRRTYALWSLATISVAVCTWFLPTVPPTTAPTTIKTNTSATSMKLLTFMPKMILGGFAAVSRYLWFQLDG